MDIKKTNLIKQIFGVNQSKLFQTKGSSSVDKVDFSQNVKDFAEMQRYKELVLNTPNIREDKVRIAREKLEKELLFSDKIYQELGDKLMKLPTIYTDKKKENEA